MINVFAQHKVAYNLLMLMMILAGLWGVTRLNVQFFPSFSIDFIAINVTWTGATAEDVETSITNLLEDAVRDVDGLKKQTSSSSEGRSYVLLEYVENTDMSFALDQVKDRIALIRNLPSTAEEPEVRRILNYEPVARMLISGLDNPSELRTVARKVEQDFLDAGIAKVNLIGLPEEEIAIQVNTATLIGLELSLNDIAERVASQSKDVPSGNIGRNQIAKQLRALDQRRSEIEFESLPLIVDNDGRYLRVGDVAEVVRRPRSKQSKVLYQGKPAVIVQLLRSESADSLESAKTINTWMETERLKQFPNVEIIVFDESWTLIRDRIFLLLKNGASGLVLVVAILFVLLNGRVAFWVAVGIPVSFMAALGILNIIGGSINMVSLFAFIMTLGIIVDDAIVVGEEGLARFEDGVRPLLAAEAGAQRMLAPVMSSSLTTVAAFLPLILVGGIIGTILRDIPTIVVCVIVASLVESFLVLPGHLRSAFKGMQKKSEVHWLRQKFEQAFLNFREQKFRPAVRFCARNCALTTAISIAILILTMALKDAGFISFQFFPTPEASLIQANVRFVAGTPPEKTEAFLLQIEDALHKANAELGENVVKLSVITRGRRLRSDETEVIRGDHLGVVEVELVEPDRRQTRNPAIREAWLKHIAIPAGVENFSISSRHAGPPGDDIDIRLVGNDANQLKKAALDLQQSLATIEGVSAITDDMPYGLQQMVFELTPRGLALGLSIDEVGQQLRAAYDGALAQIFQLGDDEIEVRVVLPDSERYQNTSLDLFDISLPQGGMVPLMSVVRFRPLQGFETLQHANGRLALRVSADVNEAVNNANAIIEQLNNYTLKELTQQYGVDYDYEGKRADQESTLGDMKTGGLYALVMIYLVLAWVFGSYGWPLVVMFIIPFGVVGALVGHWVLGLEVTLLSMFGLFGLSGIVVNDSIILVVFYKELCERGVRGVEGIVEAACQRFRAVLLTSLTTIAGLIPLMFEKSLQAQFLIPMAVSISFGLAFATFLVLLQLPALLRIHELTVEFLSDKFGWFSDDTVPTEQG